MSRKYKTGFLFSSVNALVGAGSIFNIAGNYFHFNYSRSGQEADARAIENDWGMVGQDIQDAALRQIILYIRETAKKDT